MVCEVTIKTYKRALSAEGVVFVTETSLWQHCKAPYYGSLEKEGFLQGSSPPQM